MGSCEECKEIILHEPCVLTLYSDGSFQRHTDLQLPACATFADGIASMDVVLNPSTGLWARIFLPQPAPPLPNDVAVSRTMPIVLHFHGGGFCLGSPASPSVHNFCTRMAAQSRSIWISVGYRLAPENPLPAAYDDGHEALVWLRAQASAAPGANSSSPVSWLSQYGNFSECFLAGESAGATIVHFLALRTVAKDWRPVRIRGLLVIHAAFTQEKDKSAKPPPMAEFYHRSMLPGGAPVDHAFLNPLHPDWPKFSEIDLPPLFVAVAEKDELRQGSEKYYEALKKAGKDAQFFASEHEEHCFHLLPNRSEAAELLEKKMIEFINKVYRETNLKQ